MRESFVLHAEYIEDLPQEYKMKFLEFIYNYGIHEIVPKLTGLELAIWKKVQRRIDVDRTAYQDKLDYYKDYSFYNKAKKEGTIGKDVTFAEFKNTETFKTFKSLNKCKNFLNVSIQRDIVNDIDTVNVNDIDTVNDIESENDIVNDGAKAPDTTTPSLTVYSNKILEIFKKAKFPCCKGNEISFLQRDFKNAIGFLHANPQYKALHSEDVLQACKNYVDIVTDPDCYYKKKMDLYSLVQNKIFWELLPDNFNKDNFKNFSAANTKTSESTAKEVDYSHAGEEIVL